MMIATLPVPDTSELERIRPLAPEPALRRAAPLLVRLTRDPVFLETHVLPLLDEAMGAGEWYVARRYGGGDGSFSLQVFVWPPGTRTRIHDHASWGVYRCVAGSVLEERYERLDDGSVPGHARLRKVWRLAWAPEDGVSTVLPFDGGIHRVGDPGNDAAVSVHLYGPRLGELDGRDYDPSRDHVCGRLGIAEEPCIGPKQGRNFALNSGPIVTDAGIPRRDRPGRSGRSLTAVARDERLHRGDF